MAAPNPGKQRFIQIVDVFRIRLCAQCSEAADVRNEERDPRSLSRGAVLLSTAGVRSNFALHWSESPVTELSCQRSSFLIPEWHAADAHAHTHHF